MKGYMMNFINKFTCIVTCAMSLISYNCNAMFAQADKDLMGLHAQLIAGLATQEQPVDEGTLIDRCLAYSLKTEQVRPFMGPILEIGHTLQSLLKHKQQLDKDDTENVTALVLRVYPFAQPDSKNQASLLAQMIIGGIQGQQTSKRIHTELTQKDCMLTSMPDDVICQQSHKKSRVEQEESQGITLTDLPWDILRLITAYLPGRDITQLAQTCRAFRDMLNVASPHMLVPSVARSLIYKFDNPLQYIRDRVPKNAMIETKPHIVIHGCRVPLLELEIATVNDIQSSIIDILASRELDPIEYVCSNAQGQPIVNLYGQEFNTVAILQQLRSLGWNPMRMQVADERLTLDSFFNNPEGKCDYSDKPIVPSVHGLQVPELFLESLSEEERLDYAPWVYVRMVDGNYEALLQKLKNICEKRPGVGIWLQIIGAIIPGEVATELRQEFVAALAKYPITALFVDDAELPEGSAIFSVLKHLRLLSISLSGTASDNLFPAALCELPELRAVQFAIDPSIEEPTLNFPKDLGNLKKLQYINMYNFRFSGLENLASLPQLRMLKLISPEFTQLPETLCDLRNLRALYWGSLEDREEEHEMPMPETFIPARIADLNKLRGLKIQYYSNAYFSLPRSIGQLESLRHLDLSGCAIEDLPEELGSLTNLHVLDLDEVTMQERFIRILYPLAIHEVEIICDDFFDSLLSPLRNRVRHLQGVIEATSFNLKVIHDHPNLDVPAEFRDYVAQITRNREFFAYVNDLLGYEQLPLHKKLEILLHAEGIQEIVNLLSDNQFQAVAKEFNVSLYFQL